MKEPQTEERLYGDDWVREVTADSLAADKTNSAKLQEIRAIVDEIIPTSQYYQILDAINRIAVIVRDDR